MKRHKIKRKHRAAKKFNRSVHRTKKVNVKRAIMRGGYRL